MTWGRAVSLGVLVAVLLGAGTGLSHVGHTTVSACNGTWQVVVGHAADQSSNATENYRAAVLVGAPCFSSSADPKGGYDAYALLDTLPDAHAFLHKLVAAGYVERYGFRPYIQQVQQQATP